MTVPMTPSLSLLLFSLSLFLSLSFSLSLSLSLLLLASAAAASLFELPYQQNENNNVNARANLFLFLELIFSFLFCWPFPFHSSLQRLCISCSVIKFLNYVYGSRNGTFLPVLSLLTSSNAFIHLTVEYIHITYLFIYISSRNSINVKLFPKFISNIRCNQTQTCNNHGINLISSGFCNGFSCEQDFCY